MIIFGVVGAVFAFSLYVFLTTENTIIIVNESALQPKENVVEGVEQPEPESQQEEPVLNSRIQILETGVGFLNVRSDASLQAAKVGTVKPGEVYEYTETKNDWYKITHPELANAWVFGQYVRKVDRSSDLFGGE